MGAAAGAPFAALAHPAIRAAIRDFSARVARAGPENAQGRAFPRLAPPRPRHGTGQNRGFCSVHVLFSRRAGRPARGMRRRRALRPAHGRRRGFAQGPLRKGPHGLIGIHNVTQPEPESAPAGRAGEGEQLGSGLSSIIPLLPGTVFLAPCWGFLRGRNRVARTARCSFENRAFYPSVFNFRIIAQDLAIHGALMRVKRLRLINYKSFEDSGWIEFSTRMNVVVGKNSSGKTALLEGFRLQNNRPCQHRSLARRSEAAGPDNSTFQIELSFAENELQDALLRGGSIHFPIKPDGNDADALGRKLVASFFSASDQTFLLEAQAGRSISPIGFPSHQCFTAKPGQGLFLIIEPNADRSSYSINPGGAGRRDSLYTLASNVLTRKLYVFKAERLNIGEVQFSEETLLADNASNLPRVLFALTTNPSLFDRYNRHVNEIFPYIRRVSVFPKGGAIDVRLWWVDPSTERADLAVPLQESGTGVGQALAILYVAMTMNNGVIVIDEPNSFLHPGAARKLIDILDQYNNQYIISTHSPEIINAADPDLLLIARWERGATRVDRVDKLNLESQRVLLAELGVTASDVFGYDAIVWVEGQTEQECFPLILQRAAGSVPTGLSFLAIRSVDELIRKQGTDAVVMDIYQKITYANTILPEALQFSFDRENRTAEYISKVGRDTQGKVRFLPARCYECFLLHPLAIANSLAAEAGALGINAPTADDVATWFDQNASKYDGVGTWTGSYEDASWRFGANAVALLSDVYRQLISVEYRKTRHSRALTEWLLDNEPDFLRPLSEYVKGLVMK